MKKERNCTRTVMMSKMLSKLWTLSPGNTSFTTASVPSCSNKHNQNVTWEQENSQNNDNHSSTWIFILRSSALVIDIKLLDILCAKFLSKTQWKPSSSVRPERWSRNQSESLGFSFGDWSSLLLICYLKLAGQPWKYQLITSLSCPYSMHISTVILCTRN